MRILVTIALEVDAKTIQEGKELAKKASRAMGLNPISFKHVSEKRTLSQNAALHLYLTMIALEAKNSGQTMFDLIKKPLEMPVTETLLKDVFRHLGNKMYGKESTTKLSKDEFSKVIDVFDRVVSERLGIVLPFPSMETLMMSEPNWEI
jgi:hypothetical protein